jgi:HEAT repeat protein
MPTINDWVRLYSSTNPSIRLRAAKRLLERYDEAPLSVLIDILARLSHEGLGQKALKCLCNRKDKELVPQMIFLLDSDDPWLREAACQILGHTGNTSATEHLLKMLDDPHVMVRRAAGFGLASLRDPSAREQILKQYERHKQDNINVVWALESALRSLGVDPNAGTDGG